MPQPNGPTKEELNAQIEAIKQQMDDINAREDAARLAAEKAKEEQKTETITDSDISKLAEPRLKNGVYTQKEAEIEKTEMGPVLLWLRSKVSRKINYGSLKSTRYEFKAGNYAEIYRGNGFMRYAPFVVKNDIESDSAWAQFTVNDFYGKKPSYWPWDWFTVKILWMPLDRSEPYAETMGTGGFKIKVEESSKAQLPLYLKLSPEERQNIIKNNRMVGMALLLKSQLQGYEKPKPNWNFYLLLAIILLIALITYFAWQGGLLNGLINWINGLSKGISIPSQPSPGR